MDFGFENIMDFDKLNLVGKVMDEIMEFQIFLPKCTEITARDLQKITKPFIPYFKAKIAETP